MDPGLYQVHRIEPSRLEIHPTLHALHRVSLGSIAGHYYCSLLSRRTQHEKDYEF